MRVGFLAFGIVLAFNSFALERGQVPFKAKTFECSPEVLTAKDKLTIRMSSPHPWELGIIDPKGDFYFLMSCEADLRASQLKDLDCDSFVRRTKLELSVASLTASPTGGSVSTPQRVFRQKGTYRVVLSQNLETENTAKSMNECSLRYVGQ